VQQSNTYVIVFSIVITIVLGGLLSLANQGLKPMQERAVELDTKSQILGAVTSLEGKKGKQILDMYDESIEAFVVDINGNIVETDAEGKPIVAEEVNVAKDFKKAPEERLLPVFKYSSGGDAVDAYIFIVYGKGLWGPIWGYVALQPDLATIKGAVFDHETETPGLGARITAYEIQARFAGKRIFDEQGNLKPVMMLKGENNPETFLDAHHIDGLSGATITAKGLNEMLRSYFSYYSAYIESVETGENQMTSL
jgi:Na+-transporting NADH:ubiquinone oxidoreductase subunit C